MAGRFRLIGEARIKPGCSEGQYVESWLAAQEVMGRLGMQSAVLHRKQNDPGVLLIVVTWPSEEIYSLIRSAVDFTLHISDDDNTRETLIWPMKFADVTVLGLGEEIQTTGPPDS